jgi:hypothetical protein
MSKTVSAIAEVTTSWNRDSFSVSLEPCAELFGQPAH